jgi:hypothetical protein|nr:MAG TPA: hypothetical protein [Bacteriophage sp.]
MSNEKVKIDFGCGTSLISGSFLILLIAKVLLHSDISWLVVFSPFLIGIGLIIILCIIWLILYCISDGRSNRDYWNDLEADYWNSLEKEGL